jgi:hypothetical protein
MATSQAKDGPAGWQPRDRAGLFGGRRRRGVTYDIYLLVIQPCSGRSTLRIRYAETGGNE